MANSPIRFFGSPGAMSDWTDYTPAITGAVSDPTKGAITVDKAQWRRIGDSMQIRYQFVQGSGGSAGSGSYSISIPSPYTIDSTKTYISEDLGAGVGTFAVTNEAADMGIGTAFAKTTTTLGAIFVSNSARDVNAAIWGSASFDLSNPRGFDLEVTIPITGWTQ